VTQRTLPATLAFASSRSARRGRMQRQGYDLQLSGGNTVAMRFVKFAPRLSRLLPAMG